MTIFSKPLQLRWLLFSLYWSDYDEDDDDDDDDALSGVQRRTKSISLCESYYLLSGCPNDVCTTLKNN